MTLFRGSLRLRSRLITAGTILATVLFAGTSFGQRGGSPDPEQVAELVVGLTDEFRVQEGRGKVVVNAKLAQAARDFAGYLASSGKFGHHADGSTPEIRARQRGYDHCIVSENIAYQYSSVGFATRELAQGFLEGWKKSPGHRRNMLDPDVTETGAAVARGGRAGHYYAVQVFGRPASRAIKFQVANHSSATIRYRIGGRSYAVAPRQTRIHAECRSGELRFDWPGKQQGTTITPKNGDRFAIVRADSGGFSLKPE